jgi:hypothetical protein
MGTFGGRGAVARAVALSAASLPLALLASCSGALDQAHTVQTHLNRIDEVTHSQVATPSADTGAAITVTYQYADSVRELGRLIGEIDRVADEQDYPSYRLDLVPAASDTDRLTVDDSFSGSAAEPEVLGNWLATTAALLGDVRYRFELGEESIDLESGAGIMHDVSEAGRIGYGFSGTVWTFRDADGVFVVAGRVSPTDVLLFQSTQRTVTSEVLPAPATTWQLERRDGHVVLDLDVGFAGGSVPPERLTIQRYGADVERLASAAMGAARLVGQPVTMRLVNPAPNADDVFGHWSSDARPVRGRDPLVRGWDRWLVDLAKA